MDKNDLVTVSDLVLVAETDWAIGVRVEDANDIYWIPKSQIDRREGLDEEDATGAVDIPRWLAEDRGLEYEG